MNQAHKISMLIARSLVLTLLTARALAADVPVPANKPLRATPAPAATRCHQQLAELGAIFTKLPPTDTKPECIVINPVEITSLDKDTKILPPATLACETALALAHFISTSAQQQAGSILGGRISAIHHASAFVCRTRHGTGKLSEHAMGRALDIGAFTLTSGAVVPVKAAAGKISDHDKFLKAVRSAACGPFTTVLGPGSDADHALHFHLDLAPRKGAPYCR